MIITVSDTGTGISKDMLPNVFERGVSDGRTGLGLFISKIIIEEVHKGEIFVESSESGTTFSIYLPVCHSEGSEES